MTQADREHSSIKRRGVGDEQIDVRYVPDDDEDTNKDIKNSSLIRKNADRVTPRY